MVDPSGRVTGSSDPTMRLLGAAWLPVILDASSTITYVKDLASRHLFVNRAFEALLGAPREQLIGRTNAELFPESAEALTNHDREIVAGGGRGEGEYEEVLVVRGEQRRYRSRKFVLRDLEGRPAAICGMSLDVTAGWLAEEQLQREQDIMRRILESSGDGVVAFDRDCRYTLWNREMERLSGLPADAVLGKVAFDVFPFLVETGEDHYFREALAGRQAVSRDRSFVIPASGRSGDFEGRYSPIQDGRGAVIGGVGIIRDVTERRRDEEERVRAARAEAARGEAEEAAQRFAFLARAGETLSSSLDYEETLRQVARLAVPTLGDLCIVDIVDGRELRPIASAHVVPEKALLAAELRRLYPPSIDSPQPAARVVRSGTAELLPDVHAEVVASRTRDSVHASLIERIGVLSLIHI